MSVSDHDIQETAPLVTKQHGASAGNATALANGDDHNGVAFVLKRNDHQAGRVAPREM